MLIGYARVSTDDQNLNLQTDALQQAGCVKIYSDRVSGAKVTRPGLSQALLTARGGDDKRGMAIRSLGQVTERPD